jgi:hypothetical protein
MTTHVHISKTVQSATHKRALTPGVLWKHPFSILLHVSDCTTIRRGAYRRSPINTANDYLPHLGRLWVSTVEVGLGILNVMFVYRPEQATRGPWLIGINQNSCLEANPSSRNYIGYLACQGVSLPHNWHHISSDPENSELP